MSNFLAVATVTEALRLFLSREVAEAQLPVQVHAQKPPTEPFTDATITIFCYQVTPNVALRNRDAPVRGSDGSLVHRPQAALDLSYLISFYGSEAELVPQKLLGSVARALYEAPILSRTDIEAAAAEPFLAGSDLAAAVDRVRFTPTHLDIDDSYKLWTMLSQTPFALSLTYLASVVVIDGHAVPAPGKPVLRRTVRAVPGGRPVVTRVLAQPADGPPVEGPVPGDQALLVEGSGLAAPAVWVQVGALVFPADEVHDDRVLLRPPDTLPAGVYPVRVRQDVRADATTTLVRVLESNAVPVVRQPRITSMGLDTLGHVLVVHCDLPVPDASRVRLLLDEVGAPADRAPHGYELDAPFPLGTRPDDGSVRVPVAGVAAGRYLARIEVDGAQSPLHQADDGTFDGPVVQL